jgi:hypothetical protein
MHAKNTRTFRTIYKWDVQDLVVPHSRLGWKARKVKARKSHLKLYELSISTPSRTWEDSQDRMRWGGDQMPPSLGSRLRGSRRLTTLGCAIPRFGCKKTLTPYITKIAVMESHNISSEIKKTGYNCALVLESMRYLRQTIPITANCSLFQFGNLTFTIHWDVGLADKPWYHELTCDCSTRCSRSRCPIAMIVNRCLSHRILVIN